MTAAPLHLVATPTPLERTLRAVARGLARYVDARIAHRAERRERMLELLRDQQERRVDPCALNIAMLSIGSRPR